MVDKFHQAFDYPRPEKPVVLGLRADSKAELRLAATLLRDVMRGLQQYMETTDDKPICVNRAAVMVEELAEFLEAMANNDLENACKELTDLQFLVAGSVVALGLVQQFPEAMRRLDVSNMSKLGPDGKPIKDARGKAVKGPNYQPVQLGDLFR
jgi:predicted HAD superfamily Cof-like phosphohydrolase